MLCVIAAEPRASTALALNGGISGIRTLRYSLLMTILNRPRVLFLLRRWCLFTLSTCFSLDDADCWAPLPKVRVEPMRTLARNIPLWSCVGEENILWNMEVAQDHIETIAWHIIKLKPPAIYTGKHFSSSTDTLLVAVLGRSPVCVFNKIDSYSPPDSVDIYLFSPNTTPTPCTGP